MEPDLKEIELAQKRLRKIIPSSPLLQSRPLSQALGTEIFLKLESLQHGGSFKYRGATNAVATLTEEERRKLQTYATPLSMVAQAMGMLLPPLFLLQ